MVPREGGSIDDDDEEEWIIREVMERTRIRQERGRAGVAYVLGETPAQPQASGSGLYPGNLQTTMAQQPRPEPQPPKQQQPQGISQSFAPVGPLRLLEPPAVVGARDDGGEHVPF